MPRIASETFYKNAIKKHGLTPAGVCWLSYAHQQIRFEMICELLPESLREMSIVDAGCGFGDFYTYLQNNDNLPQQYTGIDAVDTMCHIAKEKTAQEIIHADITNTQPPVSDFVICSGAMNVLTPFETVQFIQNCYKAAKKGFVFNVLYGEKESQTYNYLSRKQIEAIASDLNVTSICLREDYLDGDITVGFYK